jgi:hypothetical protein
MTEEQWIAQRTRLEPKQIDATPAVPEQQGKDGTVTNDINDLEDRDA